jgi:hypothetical protein
MEFLRTKAGLILSLSGFLTATSANAQLAECEQLDISNEDVPGSCIEKSLEAQIGAGHGDEFTSGSAVYLIKRDPARSIRRGRQLFQRKFSYDEGLGPRVNDASTGDVTTHRALGAGLSDSCAACHGRPRGSAGFGGDVATRPDSRDAPHLFGLGIVEQLAEEMTAELRNSRDEAIAMALGHRRPQERKLIAKGVRFGTITVQADGTVDTSRVSGVDKDLRVRPFFHDGKTASIREFIIGALNDEMGLQAWDPVLCAVTDPLNPVAMTSPAGFNYDPTTDNFNRPEVCADTEDADQDGHLAEFDPGLVDHMEFYLLNYFKPGRYEISRQVQNGQQLMQRVGCNSCHTPHLTIDSDRRVADVETEFDPENGIFNEMYATASTRFDVIDDDEDYPQLLPQNQAFEVRNFYSDLKRHDLGPAFHERDYDGSVVTGFVTEPLWGVGSTAPYGHDGRSINLDSVIRRHGGEAERSAHEYARLDARQRQNVIAFLQSLVLFPPDDTASNLKPGNPVDVDDIQHPDSHGSINLGALFQINEEGAE